MLILAVGTVVAAGAALAVWTVVAAPTAPPYLAQLQQYPAWLAVIGVLGFAVVNPIWEEIMFRGVVLEDLTAIWGPGPAVVVQALLFGAAHWAGFPSGWVGMLMAAAWGLVLGILRLRTRGILVPYLVHVTANAVIGSLAVTLL
jgi:membrane protease YdiL (CAAX protease family)